MSEAAKNSQAQTCPQCDNHCPVDDLRCGRGRKYFNVTEDGHTHSHPKGGLPGLLHQCGRFVRHTDMHEDELFQALTDEEKATLQALLDKLSADWQTRFGGETFCCCGHGHHDRNGEKHHHKHEGHGK